MLITLLSDLMDMAASTEWIAHGRCAETDPEAFFTEEWHTESAKQVCAGCPVRQECLAYARTEGIEFGVWGGLSEQERRPHLAA